MSLSWWSWWERILYHDKTPRPPAPQAERSSTAVTNARRLYQGAMVLTPSTPYRYKVERVLWIEKQPLNGPVVANLEGTDPDTGETKQRWHQWRSDDMVAVFTADVDVEPHGGDFDALLERYGMAEQHSEDGQWHRVSKLAFPE